MRLFLFLYLVAQMPMNSSGMCATLNVPDTIHIDMQFVEGNPNGPRFNPYQLPLLQPSDSIYHEIATKYVLLSDGAYEINGNSYRMFLCRDSASTFLLVASTDESGAIGLKRYGPDSVVNGSYEFSGIKISKIFRSLPSYSIFLRVVSLPRESRLGVFIDWYRKGHFKFLNTSYDLILYKASFPGYEFFLDYDDYLVIDTDHDGVFDPSGEGDQLNSRFHIGKYVYKLVQLDSLGRDLTLAYSGIDSVTLQVGERCVPLVMRFLNGSVDSSVCAEGKVTLLDFWATWCGPCVAEMPELKKLYEKYERNGFEIIGIASESDLVSHQLKVVNDFIRQEKLPWRVALLNDSLNKNLASRFRLTYLPKHVLIDRKGIIKGNGMMLTDSALKKLVPALLGIAGK